MRAIASLALASSLAIAWLACRENALARSLERRFWSVLLRGFQLRLHTTGDPASGALLAANHISWADIPVLAATGPTAFVAKAEIAQWPIIGALATRARCIFVNRTRRSGLQSELQHLKAQLTDGANIVLFPEGTTGSGTGLLTFRSSLFEGLRDLADAEVQPVAIRYLSRDGQQLDPVSQRRVAWLGSDSLLPHALELAAQGGFVVEVAFLDPFKETDRKAAAKRCQTAISDWLAETHAATLKRCA